MAIVMTGAWGSTDGISKWSIPDDLYRIKKIYIAAGSEDCVHSIMFSYEDINGRLQTTNKFGGDGGEQYTITIGDNEEITRISGTFGEHDNVTVITSLAFGTNQGDYGPFGKTVGTNFSLGVIKGKFFGFYGTYGNYVESFGATINPPPYN
ncbi:hypothetical protein OSB04_un000375 [Centaurea solstitialis]|uniref:Jacalin-type lectin domain-containing protein n=1 Tax=Centaurea solstitialis TaxID=347529 RepID=A0AA38SHU7_9ASTR|nr:hypothetical protein OSB04_un000375 [Centaurea solstitialis]